MRLSALELHHGKRIPWWAGVAWPCETSLSVVILPLGLHWIAGWLRRWFHEFRLGYQGRCEDDTRLCVVRWDDVYGPSICCLKRGHPGPHESVTDIEKRWEARRHAHGRMTQE